MSYANVTHAVGAVVSSGRASMAELMTVLSLEDLYNVLEVISVDAHNRRLVAKLRAAR